MGKRNWSSLTEEQIAQHRAQDAERKRLRRQQETAEERTRRRARNAEKAREYRAALRASNPVLAAKKRAEAALRMRMKRALDSTSGKDNRNKKASNGSVSRIQIDMNYLLSQAIQMQEALRQINASRDSQGEKKTNLPCPMGSNDQNLSSLLFSLIQFSLQQQSPLSPEIASFLSVILGRIPSSPNLGNFQMHYGTSLSTALLTSSLVANSGTNINGEHLNPLLLCHLLNRNNSNESLQLGITPPLPLNMVEGVSPLLPMEAQPTTLSIPPSSQSDLENAEEIVLPIPGPTILPESEQRSIQLPEQIVGSGLNIPNKDTLESIDIRDQTCFNAKIPDPSNPSEMFPESNELITTPDGTSRNIHISTPHANAPIATPSPNMLTHSVNPLSYLPMLHAVLGVHPHPIPMVGSDTLAQQLSSLFATHTGNPVALFELLRILQMTPQQQTPPIPALSGTPTGIAPLQDINFNSLLASSVSPEMLHTVNHPIGMQNTPPPTTDCVGEKANLVDTHVEGSDARSPELAMQNTDTRCYSAFDPADDQLDEAFHRIRGASQSAIPKMEFTESHSVQPSANTNNLPSNLSNPSSEADNGGIRKSTENDCKDSVSATVHIQSTNTPLLEHSTLQLPNPLTLSLQSDALLKESNKKHIPKNTLAAPSFIFDPPFLSSSDANCPLSITMVHDWHSFSIHEGNTNSNTPPVNPNPTSLSDVVEPSEVLVSTENS